MDLTVSISLIYIISFTLFIKYLQYIKSIKLLSTMYFTGVLKRTTCASRTYFFIRSDYVWFFFHSKRKKIMCWEKSFQSRNLKVQDLLGEFSFILCNLIRINPTPGLFTKWHVFILRFEHRHLELVNGCVGQT